MSCATPQGVVTVPANSTSKGMKAGARVDFYVPPTGSGVVKYAFSVAPPMAGLKWWIVNAAGSVLQTGTPSGVASGAWSLGTSDPHSLYFTTSYSLLGVGLDQVVTYELSGACTTPQPVVGSCNPNPCATGCTCAVVGAGHTCTCPPPNGGTPPPATPASSGIIVVGAVVVGAVLFMRHKQPVAGAARRRRA